MQPQSFLRQSAEMPGSALKRCSLKVRPANPAESGSSSNSKHALFAPVQQTLCIIQFNSRFEQVVQIQQKFCDLSIVQIPERM